MSRSPIRFSLALSLLMTTACTQPPAQVDLKGQNTYGLNMFKQMANNVVGNNAPTTQPTPAPIVYANAGPVTTQTTAALSPISSKDLAPIGKQAAAAPIAKPAPVALFSKPQPKPQQDAFNLRPTGKPQYQQMASEVRLSTDKPQPKAAVFPGSLKPSAGKPSTTKFAANESSSFMWPVADHKVISGFGPKGSGKVNDGINIASPSGEPIWASADGEVVYVGNELQGYGNMVIIKHAGGKNTTYAHMARYTVDKYDHVKQGDIIGYVGATGNVKEPQLHFAIRDGKEPLDPQKYLSRNVAGL